MRTASCPGAPDPLAAIRSLAALATPGGTTLLVTRNLHRFLGSAEVVQALDSRIAAGKQDRTFVVVLAPVVQVPVELERLFAVVDHELPGRDQLGAIARGVATEPGELPGGEGLTCRPRRGGGADPGRGRERLLALAGPPRPARPRGPLGPQGPVLKKAGLLTLHRGGERFADLGGLGALKDFCSRALGPGRPAGVRARGILLLGVPGTGKSMFAKALGGETGRPTLVLDVGSLMGSLVGQTEQRVREALRAVDAMAPCVVFCDELEKALAGSRAARGTRASGPGSSGRCCRGCRTTSRTPSSSAPATTSRSSRPSSVARSGSTPSTSSTCPAGPRRSRSGGCIRRGFGLDPSQARPSDRDWTGAEIRRLLPPGGAPGYPA